MQNAIARYPGVHGLDHWQAILEQDAGYLLVEECVAAHLQQARMLGAQIRVNQQMLRWRADNLGVEVQTERETLHADKLILCAGPWASQVLSKYQ
ncbi:MAG: FAD-dependent oxidoreductase, partial [Pirellula sp.]